jgi:hypothetical protein
MTMSSLVIEDSRQTDGFLEEREVRQERSVRWNARKKRNHTEPMARWQKPLEVASKRLPVPVGQLVLSRPADALLF